VTKEHRVWIACSTLALVGLVQACATSKPAKTSPECSDIELAKIEAAYITEATAACAGQSYTACDKLPALRDKYDSQRKAWVSCAN
jgi:hypothetical protein